MRCTGPKPLQNSTGLDAELYSATDPEAGRKDSVAAATPPRIISTFANGPAWKINGSLVLRFVGALDTSIAKKPQVHGTDLLVPKANTPHQIGPMYFLETTGNHARPA